MAGGTIFAQIQIELVIFGSKSQLVHTGFQFAVIVFSLASADDLSDSRNQAVHGSDRLIVVVLLHIEGFDLLRIVSDEYRFLENLLGEIALMLCLKITAPEHLVVEFVIVLLQKLD